MPPDSELVGAYVAERSESAFRALVLRHVNLVYATAVRQVGDSGIAQEITQNVFIALAKKAPRLARLETLAGWLHRTAILESKTRIRSELRRRTREEAAAALAVLEGEGESPLEALVPLVDEALLQLREADRIALVLRFFENQTLREVGMSLGVDEDAARKRVSRALDRVAEFFRQRGFATRAGAGVATLLANSAKAAAPAGLANAATQTGFAAGGAASAFDLLLFQVMNVSAAKAVIASLIVASAPILWQSHLQARIDREHAALLNDLAAANRQLDDLELKSKQVAGSILLAQSETEAAQGRFAKLEAQRSGRAKPLAYEWDDNSPYMRLPKQFLESLPSAVAGRRASQVELNETAAEFLQMTGFEIERAQAALQQFYEGYQNVLMQKVRRVEPTRPTDATAAPVPSTTVRWPR